MTDADAVALTIKWLERAVIGLNLCPFAKSVHVKGQIHYAVTHVSTHADVLDALKFELNGLQAQASIARDTTLLIAPLAFPDFLDFNDFLPDCDRLLRRMKLDGIFQIASFHPKFQFAGTDADDITNYTNRAPFPILHLLREDSMDRAVAAFPEPDVIFETNMQTLENLGIEGWSALGVQAPSAPTDRPDHGKIAP